MFLKGIDVFMTIFKIHSKLLLNMRWKIMTSRKMSGKKSRIRFLTNEMKPQLTIEEIMTARKPVPDPGGISSITFAKGVLAQKRFA